MQDRCRLPILLLDQSPRFLDSHKAVLRAGGYSGVLIARDGCSACSILEIQEVAVILLDISMPGPDGHHLLRLLRERFPQIPVIAVTEDNQVETAVECMKGGACDVLLKPVDSEKLLAGVARAVDLRSSAPRPTGAGPCGRLPDHFAHILTRNPGMLEVQRYVEMVAPSQHPVLILGETGVGKELFARALHDASGRIGAFVAVNLAGVDDTMFSDTLFGHKKGTYTGADSDREGLITRAAGGTLFLDEIGDLSETAQIRLLRLIQEQEYYRLGCDTPCKSEARIVLATNRDLRKGIVEGAFRKDLYYRLFTHQVVIPPLRARYDDLPLLLESFVAFAAQSLGRDVPTYHPELVTLLSSYPFPGNVRELQAMTFEAVARSASGNLGLDLFKEIIRRERLGAGEYPGQSAAEDPAAIAFTRFPTLKEAENVLINRAIALAKSNQGVAASMLGISRQALNRRLQLMGE